MPVHCCCAIGRPFPLQRSAFPINPIMLPICLQNQRCAAPAGSLAASYYCSGSADGASLCFNQDTTAWCSETALSSSCAQLQPYSNGDCKLPENVQIQYSGSDPGMVGVHYGPSAICLGVPGGSLTRSSTPRVYSMSVACVAAECDATNSNLDILIVGADGSGYKAYACPEGGYLQLGESDGFPSGVRTSLLHCAISLLYVFVNLQ